MVGSHNTKFNEIFDINLIDGDNKYNGNIEDIWKYRTNKCKHILICKVFNIEKTQRGGYDNSFTDI